MAAAITTNRVAPGPIQTNFNPVPQAGSSAVPRSPATFGPVSSLASPFGAHHPAPAQHLVGSSATPVNHLASTLSAPQRLGAGVAPSPSVGSSVRPSGGLGSPASVMEGSNILANGSGLAHRYAATPMAHTLSSPSGQPGGLLGAAAQEIAATATLFPKGASILRMLQYTEAVGAGANRGTPEYWRSIVSEFYMPEAMYRLVLCNSSSLERKGFEVPCCALARYLHTTYTSGVKSAHISLEAAREYLLSPTPSAVPHPPPPPPPSSKSVPSFPSPYATHLVQSTRARYVSTYDSGWQVQMLGRVRVTLRPHAGKLKIESFDYVVESQGSFLPRTSLGKVRMDTLLPANLVSEILSKEGFKEEEGRKRAREEEEKERNAAAGGESTGPAKKEEGDGEERERKKIKSEQRAGYALGVEQIVVPDSPVNEYGVTLRGMRCLEITESICQLRDLMDFSMREKLGPIDALRQFATQYRELQSRGASDQALLSLPQLGMSGAQAMQNSMSGVPGTPGTAGLPQGLSSPAQPQQQQSRPPSANALGGPPNSMQQSKRPGEEDSILLGDGNVDGRPS